MSERAKVVKTWLQGWATTHRIKGDHLHVCMLGCAEGEDSLSHYLNCPRVFGSISFFWPGAPADPVQRCGLCSPSKQTLKWLACTFSAYHDLKSKYSKDFEASNHVQTHHMDKYWVFFAQSLRAEAVMCGLTIPHFDPRAFCIFSNRFRISTMSRVGCASNGRLILGSSFDKYY